MSKINIYNAEFKAKVVLELMSGQKTLNELVESAPVRYTNEKNVISNNAQKYINVKKAVLKCSDNLLKNFYT